MKEIQLTQGRVAQVDDEDYKYLTENFSWCVSGKPGNEYVTMNGNSIVGSVYLGSAVRKPPYIIALIK